VEPGTAKNRLPRSVALVGVLLSVGLVTVLVAILMTHRPIAAPRLSAPVTDQMQTTTLPVWATGQPRPTLIPSLSKQDASSLTSLPWQFIALNNGRDLEIQYVAGDGDCVLPKGFAVTYSATAVEVWALSRTEMGREACASRLVTGIATLHLAQPLGERSLVHAPTDLNWPSAHAFG
jgi:hypothetical protein